MGLGRGVGEPGPGRGRPLVERRHRAGAAGPAQEVGVPHERRDVVAAAVVLPKAHAGRHLQQVAERRASVLGAGQLGHVGRRLIVDRADVALGDRDADQHRGHGLGHRPRREALPVGAVVLVALDEDGVVARDQQPGRQAPRQVVVQRRENEAAGEDLVHVAMRADRVPDAIERRAAPLRVARGRAELVRVGAGRREMGPGLLAGGRRVTR